MLKEMRIYLIMAVLFVIRFLVFPAKLGSSTAHILMGVSIVALAYLIDRVIIPNLRGKD